jgi:hypothetical protein
MTRDYEPERDLQRLRIWAARMNGEQADWPDNPLRDGLTERRELITTYQRQLESLLTPEQYAALPFGPDRDERLRDRRGSRDREEQRRRMLDRFDQDGDGRLSDEEREAARESRREGRDG